MHILVKFANELNFSPLLTLSLYLSPSELQTTLYLFGGLLHTNIVQHQKVNWSTKFHKVSSYFLKTALAYYRVYNYPWSECESVTATLEFGHKE